MNVNKLGARVTLMTLYLGYDLAHYYLRNNSNGLDTAQSVTFCV